MAAVKVLCWNIRAGGGKRVPRIVEELAAHDADVIALTAFRDAPGRELRRELSARGWDFVETTNPEGNGNGIAVFSRTPVEVTRRRDRWLEVLLPECGFGLGVLQVMAASGAKHASGIAKKRFWDEILDAAEERLQEPALLMGHWNTGAHGVDEKGKTFICAEQFERLSTIGWTDLWRRSNPGATEWTWRSRLNGFRVDHAFASPALLPRVESCRYSHAEREAGVSDHSITVVELAATC